MKAVSSKIRYATIEAAGLKIFYREAGIPGAPKLLLLHGFPSAGHMFRDLIPRLSDKFHIVAPDLPGFGHKNGSTPEHKFSVCLSALTLQTIERRTAPWPPYCRPGRQAIHQMKDRRRQCCWRTGSKYCSRPSHC